MDIRLYESICFPVCGFLFSTFMLITYLSKGKKTKISYRYIVAISICFITSILENLNPFLIMNLNSSSKLLIFLVRLLPLSYFIFRIQTLLIVSMAVSKNGKEYNGNKMAKYATYILGYGASIILSASLPIKIINVANIPISVQGTVVVFADIFAFIISVAELTMLKKSGNKHNLMALYSFLVFFAAYITMSILQLKYNYYINASGVFNIMLLIIAYMTFENQDYKKLKKISDEEKELNKANKIKDEELNQVYYDIRTEVSTILDDSKIVEENTDDNQDLLDDSVKSINNSIKKLDGMILNMKEGANDEV